MKNKLYEFNFNAWLDEQIVLLREKDFKRVDIDNLIEELQDLANSQYKVLQSYLENLLKHLLKAKYGERSWNLSIKAARKHANRTIEKNPGLKAKLKETFLDAYEIARLEAAAETGLDEDIFPEKCPWSLKQVLEEKK